MLRPTRPPVPAPAASPTGAGKTTLLDVLAGRKNSGVAQGSILLNGFPKEQKSFARLTAYCEQVGTGRARGGVWIRVA